MIKVEIHGKQVLTEVQLHDILIKVLNFPEDSGKNLDALWDLMTEPFEDDVLIEWFDFKESQRNLGCDANKVDIAQSFKQIFEEASDFYKESKTAHKITVIIHD